MHMTAFDIVEGRKSICARCDAQCDAFKSGAINHADPKAYCPRPWPSRWSAARFGLGDLVSSVAEPIARASDAIFKTNLVGCEPCAKRREALNKFIPDLGVTPSEKP
jgi:hypothetical protein